MAVLQRHIHKYIYVVQIYCINIFGFRLAHYNALLTERSLKTSAPLCHASEKAKPIDGLFTSMFMVKTRESL